ncbi:nitroreductase family deazaflavin-dependent oxidoreductase [Nocardia sp. NPDC051030]|uniref:nitroreductase family deazaflavin-dependent oxidoreductase n=1 Tax=Nocardia sp. NPDC051030 TaxID=3155162 RepID=UPI00341BA3E4
MSQNSLSLWFQRKMNARTTARIRRKGGKFMGMDLLILHTVGRKSGHPRQSPLSWFPDGPNAWLVIASGGGNHHPDWYANLMAHPDQASVELHGHPAVHVKPHRLEGPDRDKAWQRIVADQPRYAKYQTKSAKQYPVIRLATD